MEKGRSQQHSQTSRFLASARISSRLSICSVRACRHLTRRAVANSGASRLPDLGICTQHQCQLLRGYSCTRLTHYCCCSRAQTKSDLKSIESRCGKKSDKSKMQSEEAHKRLGIMHMLLCSFAMHVSLQCFPHTPRGRANPTVQMLG